MTKILNMLVACGFACLVSCGGSNGSEGSSISTFEGTWRGELAVSLDQCLLEVNPLSEVHQVSIDGDDVTLISTDNRPLQGTVTSGENFEVLIYDGQAIPTTDSVTYTAISNGVAEVEIRHVYAYGRPPQGCVTVWTGRMRRD